MKNKAPLFILFLIAAASTIFSILQYTRIKSALKMIEEIQGQAIKNLDLAIAARTEADANAKEAQEQKKLAMEQKEFLNQALEECRKRNRK